MSTTRSDAHRHTSNTSNTSNTSHARSASDGRSRSTQESKAEAWPALPLAEWQATYDTLHMWVQIAGKVKLELCPFLNEWWEVALHPSARGLTTQKIPYQHGAFEIEFDFITHNLFMRTSWDATKALPLISRPVADFYREFMASLAAIGIDVTINTMPQEIEQPIPFERDTQHATYNPEHAHRYWRMLTSVANVFEQYRARFRGKSSSVQFFWGSFDLCVTRYSGKPAEPPTTGGRIMRYAEDAQNVSAGFWPGGKHIASPAFYSYTYPEPSGFKQAKVRPAAAHYDETLGEFILSYEDVRKGAKPEQAIMDFLESTYEAGAKLAGWDIPAFRQRTPAGLPS